ncbi:PEGA domain-containing protein [Sediminitomix flava]|uniref:PEGA domain-containing protein n=1 Tax=Sediminitomix flava TaxID=379075 RepID=A0A315Z5S3_SEDFL|nr:PEGA domain-containing protein [Sediminitomix flava]PWJ39258.1 PEGA domain-containing protein [Sediminitomix flava]
MKTRLFYSLLVLFLLTGCASIVHGPSQLVNFSSQPSGAKIFIDGKEYGQTPSTVSLKRMGRLKGEASTKQSYNVKVELEGFYPYEVIIKREMDGWFLGNILFGGLVGIIIDAASGAMYKLTPDQVIAQLGTKSPATVMNSKNNEQIFFAVTLTPDPTWEKIGQLEVSAQ